MPSLIPTMAIPAVCTSNLRGLLPYYRDSCGFDVKQEVPGVLAVLQRGLVRLQLWQQPAAVPRDLRITLQGSLAEFFKLHAGLARHCRPEEAETPRLQPWAAWEFSLTDAEGNRLTFVRWHVNDESGQRQNEHGSGRGRQPAP